jgi:hypothetical protein
VFPDLPVAAVYRGGAGGVGGAEVRLQEGDYAAVLVERSGTGTLMGRALGKTTLQGFHSLHGAAFAEAADTAVAR